MPQTAAAMRAARVSPRLSKPCVTAPPPHWNCSQAAKNREKTAQPMSTVKKRRLRALLLPLTGSPAPKKHKSRLRRYLFLLAPTPRLAHPHPGLPDLTPTDDPHRLGGGKPDLSEPPIQ